MKTIEELTTGCPETILEDCDIAEALAEAMAADFIPCDPKDRVSACRKGLQEFLVSYIGSCFLSKSLADDAVREAIMHGAARIMGWKHKHKG